MHMNILECTCIDNHCVYKWREIDPVLCGEAAAAWPVDALTGEEKELCSDALNFHFVTLVLYSGRWFVLSRLLWDTVKSLAVKRTATNGWRWEKNEGTGDETSRRDVQQEATCVTGLRGSWRGRWKLKHAGSVLHLNPDWTATVALCDVSDLRVCVMGGGGGGAGHLMGADVHRWVAGVAAVTHCIFQEHRHRAEGAEAPRAPPRSRDKLFCLFV